MDVTVIFIGAAWTLIIVAAFLQIRNHETTPRAGLGRPMMLHFQVAKKSERRSSGLSAIRRRFQLEVSRGDHVRAVDSGDENTRHCLTLYDVTGSKEAFEALLIEDGKIESGRLCCDGGVSLDVYDIRVGSGPFDVASINAAPAKERITLFRIDVVADVLHRGHRLMDSEIKNSLRKGAIA
jgi:hypothetical protein